MAKVPDAYYQFIMDYAPYVYVIPESGPDMAWGRAAFAAAFAVDFLFEAYFDPQFDDRSAEIESKIVELADWILTQQCTDSEMQAYGGFKSAEYNVDARTQTLETLLELGREQPLLADYVFTLKSKTDSLSRYKLARV